jgi:L-2-hydroxycarboxylate dehydrogenase (NAD+)
MKNSRVRLTVAEARALGEGALRSVGYSEEDARIIADHCIDAALCGYEYSGLPKILNVPESPTSRNRTGRSRPCMRPTSR